MKYDPQQWTTALEIALLDRSTPIVYAVSTNWWNDFRTWLMLLKEGFELQFDEGDSFLGHSNKPDNSQLIKEGNYNERTMLHQQMKDLQKDNIKIIQDYFMIDPQRFHINSDYSLISSEAYLMITKLTGGGPHIRLFLQDSKDDQQENNTNNNLNIITSAMEGSDCIGQGKIISLDVVQLGVILIHNETATLEVGYYPNTITLQEIVNAFQMNWILYSNITVDLQHCKKTPKYSNDTESNEGNNSIPSQDVLKKTIDELSIGSGSIIGFTLNPLKNQDGCELDFGQELANHEIQMGFETNKKQYRRRGNRDPPGLGSQQNMDQGTATITQSKNILDQEKQLRLRLEQVSNSQSNSNTTHKDLRNNSNEISEGIHEVADVHSQKNFHSDLDSPNQLGKNNSANHSQAAEDDGNTQQITTVQLHALSFNEKQDSNVDTKSQQSPSLRGNRRGNVLLRKKPDNSNASTEENGNSIPDTEDDDDDRGNSRSQLSLPIMGAFIGLISVEEIAEIRMQVDQCQSGQLILQALPQKITISNLEDMVDALGEKINELKQLKVKAEMNTSNSKNEENTGKILRRENNPGENEEGEEEEDEGDRKEEDDSERTSSTSTQPDTGKCFKNKKPRRNNILGMNQNLHASYLLDQSNMTDADEQAS